MPMYSYHCTSCGKSFDKMQSYSEESIKDCPYCKAKGSVKKVFSDVAVIYHGNGYYCTDHPHSAGCSCSSCAHKN